jgi:hypothetical protein
VTTFLVDKETFELEEITTILLEIDKVKKPANNLEVVAFVVKSISSHGFGYIIWSSGFGDIKKGKT